MDPSPCQQHQEEMQGVNLVENMYVCSKSQQERKARPQQEVAIKCPRCDSTNTKFCYYNNYSLSQPRYFCKSCRRYWTKGGTLRNVPVGGGCRKNKRSSSSKKFQDDQLPQMTTNNPLNNLPLMYDHNDLTLAFATLQKQSCGVEENYNGQLSLMGNPNPSNIIDHTYNIETPPFLDALRSGFLNTSNNFHNFYNVGNLGDHDQHVDCNVNGDQLGLASSYEDMAIMKEEDQEKRVLWGFPWQVSDNTMAASIHDYSGRQSWNIINGGLAAAAASSSSWHGLVNSALI